MNLADLLFGAHRRDVLGLLLRAPQGNQVVYRANPDCPIYEELRGIFKKTHNPHFLESKE